ncbi:MAG: type II secretion system protein [Elusimicrobiaceae bacterium]|nr:type II secretion system protein [Elusimicrobiaceae bacterium]
MNRKGFTLIELLVVVLIIGILSGVALPQYMKSIRRSRSAEAWQVGKSLMDAEHLYFLENREYTDDTTQLRIQPPTMKNFTIDDISTSPSAPWYVRLAGVNSMDDVEFTFILNADGSRQLVCYTTDLTECINLLPCAKAEITDLNTIPGSSNAGKVCSM